MKREEKIEEAKRLYKTANADQRYVLETLFPELKELEDERIRKRIIALINAHGQSMYKDEMLAWLEKQKTSEEALQYLKENHSPSEVSDFQAAMNIAVAKAYDKGIKDGLEKQGEKPIGIRSRHATGKLTEIIKDIEATDKVEPKFHEGDWITNGATNPAQISSIKDGMYFTHNDTIGGDVESIDKEYHLWTLADAKAGDVLYHKAENGIEFIVMNKGLNEFNNIDSYFRYSSIDGFGIDVPSVLSAKYDSITPATKEQRDTLKKAMNDAGYTFDFEKKELKKIEQKPAWSEEDEAWLKESELIICFFTNDESCRNEYVNWLKSLKDRVQPKSQWKPSDKQLKMLDKIIDVLDRMQLFSGRNALIDLKHDLKKLRGE